MNLSAEFIDSLRFERSRNYYKDPGISGIITRTSRQMLDITKRANAIIVICFEDFIQFSLYYKVNLNILIFLLDCV